MGAKKKTDDVMDKLMSLCKRRGYIFPSSEIYGGLSSCWDYGPLGAELKRNLKSVWWKTMTTRRNDSTARSAKPASGPTTSKMPAAR